MFDIQWNWMTRGLGGLVNMFISLKSAAGYIRKQDVVAIEQEISRLQELTGERYYTVDGYLNDRVTGEKVMIDKVWQRK